MRAILKALVAMLFANRHQVSSLQPMSTSRTVYPLCYNKNNPMEGFNQAALSWSFEVQQETRLHYECEDPLYTEWYAARCKRMRELVDQEIAMEEALVEAQEVLVRRG